MILPKELAGLLPPAYDPDYVEHAVVPFLLSDQSVGERPSLPMIDVALSKQDAAPPHFWGMLYDGWEPDPQDGVAVFIQGYEQRGPDNERKKIYHSATTPDLYEAKYAGKVRGFMARLLGEANAGKPLMQRYYADYFDLYWDLHLGVSGAAIPAEVRQIGASFIDVLGHWYPTSDVVHDSVMRVRELRPALREWIDGRVQAVIDGDVAAADETFVYYWLKNGGGESTSAARTSSSSASTTSSRSASGATWSTRPWPPWRPPAVTPPSGRGSRRRCVSARTRRTPARSPRSTGS